MLEVEFERAFPYLHREAQARKPDDNWSVKAPMVAHLERGLAKMQHEVVASRPRHPIIPPSIDEKKGISSGSGSAHNNYRNARRSTSSLPQYTRYSDVYDAGGNDYARKVAEDDYFYQQHHQHLTAWQGGGPALHTSSSSSTLNGKSLDEQGTGNMNALTVSPNLTPTTTAMDTGSALPDRRGRSSSGVGKNLFKRIMQSGRPDAPPSR
jgi:hypothetical protein